MAGGGGGDGLKLLGIWPSPFVLRVKLALSFKGLDYENIEEDFPNKSELLLASNPVHKKVPVLIHHGKPVCESRIIVEYIDETFAAMGPPLLPADPYDRALARFWVAYIDDKLLPSMLQTARGKTEEEKAEGRRQTLSAAKTLEAAFKELLKGKPFFGGDAVGYLDVALGGLSSWVHASVTLFDLRIFDGAETPLLAAWLERFGALDAARTVLPDVVSLVDYNAMREAQLAAQASNK